MSEICCKSVWHGPYRSSQCGKPAKFEVNGNHFCGIHNPNKAKTKAQIEAEEHQKILAKKYRLERAAPDLLGELENCLDLLVTCFSDSPVDSCMGVAITKARAAIAKAKGEGA